MLEFFFFESLFPESFHILVVHLEELIEGSGSDVSAAIESLHCRWSPIACDGGWAR